MSWLTRLLLRRRAEIELDAELRDHVERLVADYRAAGMSDREARRRARAEFGGVERVKEDCRDVRPARWLEVLLQDVRHAGRVLRRHAGFASTTVLCLALGIGANAAVFSVFSAVLLRPLPYTNPDRLGIVYKTSRTQQDRRSTFGPAEFLDWRNDTHSFEALAMYVPWTPSLTGVDQAAYLTGIRGSGALLHTLGVAPLLGRTFGDADEKSGEHVVVISHRLWQQAFHGDATLLGRGVVLDGQPHIIIGIMPPAFQFPGRQVDVWAPLTIRPEAIDRGEVGFPMLARLRPGVSWAQASAELAARVQTLRREYANTYDDTAAGLLPLRDWLVGGNPRQTLWLLLGAVAVLLLTACVNVANLMLAHGMARRQEMLVRLALGATRRRVMGQLLTESVLLGLAGCVLGLLISLWARDAFVNLLPAGSAYRLAPIVLDWRVITYSLVLSMASVVGAGLLPAIRAARSDLATHGPRVTRVSVRAGLLVAQTAAAVVLLAGATLLVRSFVNVWNIDTGFSRANVVAGRVSLPTSTPPPAQTAFYDRLLDRLAAAPQVEAVGAVSFLPLSGEGSGGYFTIEGRPDLDLARGTQPGAARLSVTPGFFSTLQIPVVDGRTFGPADTNGTPLVVINRAFADQFFPGVSPVGRRIKRGTLPAPFPWMTVIGVVGNVKLLSLFDQTTPTVFLSHAQTPSAAMTVVSRTAGTAEAMALHLRSAVQSIDPTQPVGAVRPFDDVVLDSLTAQRFPMLWLVCFALLAVTLSALGVHGVVSYALRERQREFVIRSVLGTSPSKLARLALRQGLWPTAIGCGIGVLAALALARLVAHLAYGVEIHDRTSLGLALVLPLLVAIAASYPSVRRVTHENPATILRLE